MTHRHTEDELITAVLVGGVGTLLVLATLTLLLLATAFALTLFV